MQLHISSFGAKLRVEDGVFLVITAQEGKVARQTFAASLVETIFVQQGTSLSADAILLAMANDIAIVVADRRGFPVGRFLSNEPKTISTVQKAQAEASVTAAGLGFARHWIIEKLEAQQAFLLKHAAYLKDKQKQAWLEKAGWHNDLLQKLSAAPLEPATLRGIEGSAGRIFFYLIARSLPTRYGFVRRAYRPSYDPFNSLLNYAYALLYVRVERALYEVGLNPYLGFMHRDNYRRKSLVYDFAEAFRIDSFQVVYRLFVGKEISAKHYFTEPDGSVWMTKEGKVRLLEKLKEAYEEKRYLRDGINQTGDQYIRRRAAQLARELLLVKPAKNTEDVHLDHV